MMVALSSRASHPRSSLVSPYGARRRPERLGADAFIRLIDVGISATSIRNGFNGSCRRPKIQTGWVVS
jgi:hypothetical protein